MKIGIGVRFASEDLIPEGKIDLTKALSNDEEGVIALNTDIVINTPSLLTQINELPDMIENDWQLVTSENGQIMLDGTRIEIIAKQVKQSKHNHAQIIIHNDSSATAITAKGREILVEINILE